MADIEFRIGGKDDTGKAIASATKGLSRLELSFGQIIKAAGGFAAVNASINLVSRGFSNLAGLVGQGVADFDKATEAQRALSKAMELNGGATDEQVAKQMSLAEALERTTNIEAETTAELMKSAAMLGVQNDQLGEVAKTAIGLSEAMGVSLEDGLKKARLATEGNFSSFNKLIPSLKDMATNEERLAAVMSLANKGLEQKTGQADGAAGAYERMSNRVGNMMEKIGEAISPFRKLAFDGIGFAADKITEMLIPAIGSMQNILEGSQGYLEAFKRSIVTAMNEAVKAVTMAEVVIANLDDVFNAMLDSGSLQVTRLVENIKHAFTVQIPAYAAYLRDVLLEAVTFPVRAGASAFEGFVKVVPKILEELPNMIQRGVKRGFAQMGPDLANIIASNMALEFESKFPELPKIAERAITDRERMLETNITNTAENIADAFNRRLAGRLLSSQESIEGLGKLALSMGGADANGKKDNSASQVGKGIRDALSGGGGLSATTGRLLTRGPGSDIPDLLRKLIDTTRDVGLAASAQAMAAESAQRIAQENNAAINSAIASSPKLAPALQ